MSQAMFACLFVLLKTKQVKNIVKYTVLQTNIQFGKRTQNQGGYSDALDFKCVNNVTNFQNSVTIKGLKIDTFIL